jgi:hydroxymethylpyrimidine pyrophosphatase-like HAD family hydrolase
MDFPRNSYGQIQTDDFYIPCQNGAMIYHYGGNNLAVWLPSIKKGNKLIKLCEENNIPISHVMEGDNELSFRFKAEDIKFIADYLKAKVSGKNIRPFSKKNLPKSDYKIPIENLQDYTKIINQIDKGDFLIVSQITDEFMTEIMAKNYRHIDIKSDIKKKCMSRQIKEYIHSMGEWDNYLEFLNSRVKDFLKKKEGESCH